VTESFAVFALATGFRDKSDVNFSGRLSVAGKRWRMARRMSRRSSAKLLTSDEARRIATTSGTSGRSHTCAVLVPSQGIHCDRSRNRRSPGTDGTAPALATLSGLLQSKTETKAPG
jgi:hypothetical protein